VSDRGEEDAPEAAPEGLPEPEPSEDAARADPEVALSRAEDHQLLRRAQAGDERAFEALVRKHQARAWRAARNLVGNDEDAADLAQEAFVRVFRNLSSFDFQHGFTTWLYRIVTNLAIDHLRRRRPVWSTAAQGEDEGEQDLLDGRVASPAEGLERAELAREVRACMDSLAPHFQSVLMLREIEGLPCNQIAEIVGATHVTVRWRLHRGRKLFQEEWERRARLREKTGRASSPGGAGERANSDQGRDVPPSRAEEEGQR
jgi:RNA polymerase sigma-70 factor (ECF subfamily)